MDKFTYFHLCNHRIRKSIRSGETVLLEVNNGKDLVDTLINGAVVLELYEVRVLEYDPNTIVYQDFKYDESQHYDDDTPGKGYYDVSDLYNVDYSKYFEMDSKVSEPLPPTFYEPLLHNRIRWIVRPPIRYQVKAKVRYTTNTYSNYAAENCPVCDGRGWYIDILNKDGKFETPMPIIKVAQRVVRNLLTKVGSQVFDTDFGTTLKQDIVLNSDDDESIFNLVRVAVSQVEDQYLTDQQELINELPLSETLIGLQVEDVYRSNSKLTKIVLKLRITTASDDQIFKFGF